MELEDCYVGGVVGCRIGNFAAVEGWGLSEMYLGQQMVGSKIHNEAVPSAGAGRVDKVWSAGSACRLEADWYHMGQS